ncbi:MAG: XdhC/CoxI family protein [Hyphomicrobiales bacterium]|nr:MAG: XdhC/CoxI family protein [Hyphomicrobiales bacterium]
MDDLTAERSALATPATALLQGAAMDAPDLLVLKAMERWLEQGRKVWLATVLNTYGSAPRPVGSMAALNDQGGVVGAVSGGCVEDDLTDWLLRDASACTAGQALTYGLNAEERARLRLPCNGQLRVWLEPVDGSLAQALLARVRTGQLAKRVVDLATGRWSVSHADAGMRSGMVGTEVFQLVLGPSYRLVLIGASEVSRYLAPIATTLGFRVDVIDPRSEYLSTWPHQGCRLWSGMPDDVLAVAPPDERTAIVALSHDPKIDDLALMEALKGPALYVGAMGSHRTTAARKERLVLFDVTEEEVGRLRGPVGLDIRARTPPEIAISIAADLVRVMRA